jgi:hypothetical protein
VHLAGALRDVVERFPMLRNTSGGDVAGGPSFGHHEPGVLSVEAERLVEGIASHAAIAIEPARLYAAALTAPARHTVRAPSCCLTGVGRDSEVLGSDWVGTTLHRHQGDGVAVRRAA